MRPDTEFSVATTEPVDDALRGHLLREDGQEDLCFALYFPSEGGRRDSALLHQVILPLEGERNVHGNASFEAAYVDRVCQLAAKTPGAGIGFLHSHPGPGWQDMSSDDIRAEQRLAPTVAAITGLPLVGLTLGTDGAWSARRWQRIAARVYDKQWARNVRVVGQALHVTSDDVQLTPPEYRDQFRRTATVWGPEKHRDLARLRVGIVGLGSVGALVAEALARSGFTEIVLIDFDTVEEHNLDRLVSATLNDVGRLKIDAATDRIHAVHTAAKLVVRKEPHSVVEEPGYRAALDCDVLFSCVDRPRPRHVLNHMAYSHLIPVIDGGIAVRFRKDRFHSTDWQLQTVGPTRPCLDCLGMYEMADVDTERAGMLDNPTYLAGLSKNHRFKQNENVFSFSLNLASLEVMHLTAMATGVAGQPNFGVQRFRYVPGVLESDIGSKCNPDCDFAKNVAVGDLHFALHERDLGADAARAKRAATSC